MYGNIGVEDPEVIDGLLAKLSPGAVVVNLGCGPNVNRHLHNLSRALSRFQFQSTLVLADLIIEPIRHEVWVPGPVKTRVVKLNAATATNELGKAQVDLVLAFGLFGALDSGTTPEGTGKAAWPVVLSECRELLKDAGRLVVSNSLERQPLAEFRDALHGAGLEVEHSQESEAVHPSATCGGKRYLMVCRKRKPDPQTRTVARDPTP